MPNPSRPRRHATSRRWLMVAVVAIAALAMAAALGGCTNPPEEEDPYEGLPELGPLPAAPPSAKVPPATGALFGAFVGTGPEAPQDFLNEEKLIGRRWVIDHRFYSTEDWDARTQWAIDQKKIPLITWEPQAEKLDDIIAGKHDARIRDRARSLKKFGVEIFMRWGHEMNGNWYPWSGALNGANAAAAQKYIAAYRKVHDLFREEGASNVVWVWCPLVVDVPTAPWNHWTSYYPGDEYVDWVGLAAYNWGSSNSCCVWQSFPTLIAQFYADYAGKKPMMIPETSSAEVGGNKAAWIQEMQDTLKTRFTAIKALVWFDINKETDWRVASSPATLNAFKGVAHDPYFNP